jgi:hypothetical protein
VAPGWSSNTRESIAPGSLGKHSANGRSGERAGGSSPQCSLLPNNDISQNVQLSMTDLDHSHVKYIDGTRNWRLPKTWHDNVLTIEGNGTFLCLGRPGTCPVLVPALQVRGCNVSTLYLPLQYSIVVSEMTLGSLIAICHRYNAL